MQRLLGFPASSADEVIPCKVQRHKKTLGGRHMGYFDPLPIVRIPPWTRVPVRGLLENQGCSNVWDHQVGWWASGEPLILARQKSKILCIIIIWVPNFRALDDWR